ncbi:SDR family oxidoreductase [Tomitella gaofuii]|uniref:SDR family oxidoreductase n=1 Tax=Tomitella gaofuii TaxID=2760083 RepID=UPI0015F95785|nr:SDR family oxidoreductase [Tomitella gaofuii]
MTAPHRHRTALVTGASSGIGLATARALVASGYTVYGTGRAPQNLPDDARVPGVHYLPLDLADTASIERCAAQAGPVDVLVNNAGESQSGPFEELLPDDLERLFRINVLGAVRLSQQVLPGMRERGYGRVVMVGSMLGSLPLAYRSSYCASKAAVRTFASAARAEFAPYGVWLTTVEPSSINTGISERRTHLVRPGSVFEEQYRRVIARLDAREAAGIPAEEVAAQIMDAIRARRPRPLYAVGGGSRAAFALKRMLPESVTERILGRRFGVRF